MRNLLRNERGHQTAANDQSIYRQIGLRLHPDRGGTMTEREAQIWYRAQEAYGSHTGANVNKSRRHWGKLFYDSSKLRRNSL
jgi:hypothetical protein